MNNRQLATLRAVFTDPVTGTLAWADIEALLKACGCVVVEGKGSAVRFVHGTTIAYFHRPHPAKEAKRYQVRTAREYLIKIGVRP
jgi:predicted RNA binding protein YcfA (HicA-like mRNA interferase family)